jgi:hypothetical protein
LLDRGLNLCCELLGRINLVTIEPKIGLRNSRIGQFKAELMPEERYPALGRLIEWRPYVIRPSVTDEDCPVVSRDRRRWVRFSNKSFLRRETSRSAPTRRAFCCLLVIFAALGTGRQDY